MDCPLCKYKNITNKCSRCNFRWDLIYYRDQEQYNILFKIIDKHFPKCQVEYLIDYDKILKIYTRYEIIVNHEVYTLTPKFTVCVNIILSYLKCREKMSWIKWNNRKENRLHNKGVLALHMGNIPYIWRGYIPLDCCRLIYSYLHHRNVNY